MNSNYIIIGADIVPTARNYDLFSSENIVELVGEDLRNIMNNASYRIFNMETPLVDEASPISKWGPALRAPTKVVAGYEELKINLLTLANNHIMDHGINGLLSTINVLKKSKISYVGVGDNSTSASQPFIFNFSSKKIGVFACVENEFSVASAHSAGANAFDPLTSLDQVSELKKSCDFVIVLYHGGKELYRYPSPYLQRLCRRIVDKGADLVVCQHSHCVGCGEKWKQGNIVYGQGNFIFDADDFEEWKTGLLVKIDSNFNVDYVPIQKINEKIRLATDVIANQIISDFEKRSLLILKPEFVINEYQKFSEQFLDTYLTACLGSNNIFVRALNKLTKGKAAKYVLRKRYKKSEMLALINYIECEAHRELFLTGLKDKLKDF